MMRVPTDKSSPPPAFSWLPPGWYLQSSICAENGVTTTNHKTTSQQPRSFNGASFRLAYGEVGWLVSQPASVWMDRCVGV